MTDRNVNSRRLASVPKIVFIALLLDLLAFTIPLPLFPRLIESFVLSEAQENAYGIGSKQTLLSTLLHLVRSFRASLVSFQSGDKDETSQSQKLLANTSHKQDIVLLGGLLGSVFSFCQFLVSPYIGKLSDKLGRKRALMITMVGNLLSALIWLFSLRFSTFLFARIVGGLSEGNVQLSTAIISDVVPPSSRARALALVGIAFSVAFTLGPSLGAYLSKKLVARIASSSAALDSSSRGRVPGSLATGAEAAINKLTRNENPAVQEWKGIQMNIYAVPALITVVLLAVETLYIGLKLPETRWLRTEEGKDENKGEKEDGNKNDRKPGKNHQERKSMLKALEYLHFAFLFCFSGGEYTLTFFTFDLFSYSNAQNGALLGFVGILSALVQGGYVRRVTKTNPLASNRLALSGMFSCVIAFFALSAIPILGRRPSLETSEQGSSSNLPTVALYYAAACLAYTSGTVVTSLSSLSSLLCDEENSTRPTQEESSDGKTPAKAPETESLERALPRGHYLGRFRSTGQLGRALGPIAFTTCYWALGPTFCYVVGAMGLVGTWIIGNKVIGKSRESSSVGGKKNKRE